MFFFVGTKRKMDRPLLCAIILSTMLAVYRGSYEIAYVLQIASIAILMWEDICNIIATTAITSVAGDGDAASMEQPEPAEDEEEEGEEEEEEERGAMAAVPAWKRAKANNNNSRNAFFDMYASDIPKRSA